MVKKRYKYSNIEEDIAEEESELKRPKSKLIGSIKKIFNKKSVPPPVTRLTGEKQDFDENNEDESENYKEPIARRSKRERTSAVELERIKLQIEALNEIKKGFNERFLAVSEEIGELRSMIIEKERQINSLSIAASKASDMVKEVRPEKLMGEVKKQQIMTEALNAKVEGNEIKLSNIIQELKTVKNQLSSHRGTEEILKLNEEIKNELVSVEKAKAIAEQHADKVEEVFVHVQKQFSEFQRFAEMAKNIDNSFRIISGEFEDFKIRFSDLVDKKDFNAFKKRADEAIIEMSGIVKENKGEVIKSSKYHNKRFDEQDSKINELLEIIEMFKIKYKAENLVEKKDLDLFKDKIKGSIIKIEEVVNENRDDIRKNLKENDKRISEHDKKFEEQDNKTKELLEIIEMFESKDEFKSIVRKKDFESFREKMYNAVNGLNSSVNALNELKEKHKAMEFYVKENKRSIQRISEEYEEKVKKQDDEINSMIEVIESFKRKYKPNRLVEKNDLESFKNKVDSILIKNEEIVKENKEDVRKGLIEYDKKLEREGKKIDEQNNKINDVLEIGKMLEKEYSPDKLVRKENFESFTKKINEAIAKINEAVKENEREFHRSSEMYAKKAEESSNKMREMIEIKKMLEKEYSPERLVRKDNFDSFIEKMDMAIAKINEAVKENEREVQRSSEMYAKKAEESSNKMNELIEIKKMLQKDYSPDKLVRKENFESFTKRINEAIAKIRDAVKENEGEVKRSSEMQGKRTDAQNSKINEALEIKKMLEKDYSPDKLVRKENFESFTKRINEAIAKIEEIAKENEREVQRSSKEQKKRAEELGNKINELMGIKKILEGKFSPNNLAKKRDFDSFREKVSNDLNNLKLYIDAVDELKEKNEAIEGSVNKNKLIIQGILKGYGEKVKKQKGEIKSMAEAIELLKSKYKSGKPVEKKDLDSLKGRMNEAIVKFEMIIKKDKDEARKSLKEYNIKLEKEDKKLKEQTNKINELMEIKRMLREEYHPKNVAKKKDLESFRESVKNNLSNLSSSVDVINELKEKHAAIEDSVNENKFNIQRISEGHKEKVEKDSYKIKNMERMIDELRERVEILKKPDIYPKLKLPEKNIQREEFPNVLDNSERHLERVKKYIKECLKKKHSPEKIKQTLIDSGWDEDKIKVAFNNLE